MRRDERVCRSVDAVRTLESSYVTLLTIFNQRKHEGVKFIYIKRFFNPSLGFLPEDGISFKVIMKNKS